MIQELWDYLTTSASAPARKEGYLYHSIALAHRARRCHQHWSEHLEECHKNISSRFSRRAKGGRLAVLGSGLLLETPLEILLPQFDQIDLVDVVHTKDVRSRVAKTAGNEKIHFTEMDLNKQTLTEKYDFVISANLLSQLPYVISNQMREGKPADDELESRIQNLSKDLQSRHIEQLCALSKERLLFSDFQLHIRGLDQKIIETSTTVDKELNLKWKPTWAWNLAPAPEFSKDYSVELIVGIAQL
jgi:hypothetical protein